jgi:xanthine/uracil/vitamin C permease (AzgA family)
LPMRGIRFDRNELAGAFGDIGTDLPLLVGVILAAKLDAASALILFGLMQIATAMAYRMPMPVQPLKAMAAIVIAQKVPGATLMGAGLAIGVVMLVLSLTGAVDWITKAVPKPVVRGIQLGLGIQLATLALKDFVGAEGVVGYCLAGAGFLITALLLGNRRFPPALLVIGMGLVFAAVFKLNYSELASGVGWRAPQFQVPMLADVWAGFLLLALPQIPLSLGNSILATRQIAEDLFPERKITAKRIGITYGLMNVINPFFGGIPTCHGSGGMAGHYAFGGRTGGSVVIYGSLFLLIGGLFSGCFQQAILVFPKPILGVLLFFEGLALMLLVRDSANSKREFSIAAVVGLIAAALPYGYLVGMVVGVALWHLSAKGWAGLGRE